MSPYRKILTIDGGGIKGVFPAAFLATIEQQLGVPVRDYFDLIAGTSTGGIIALALGLNISPETVLSLYLDRGARIFPPGKGRSLLRCLWMPKWDASPLRVALQDTFGDAKLGDSKIRLVIPALSGQSSKVYVYKTRHHPRFEFDHNESAVDVAMSTAAAPIFFNPHTMQDGRLVVDGGMWANNPLGMAVVEAIGVLGWPANQIKALSIGCTTSAFIPKPNGFTTPLQLAIYIKDLFMQGQLHGSNGTAKLLIGGDNIIRVDPETPPGRYSLDEVARLHELKGLAAELAREKLPVLREHFFTERADGFIPYP